MIYFGTISVNGAMLQMLESVHGQALTLPPLHSADISGQMLDNVNAAVLNAKLPHIEKWIVHRRKIASQYRQGLSGIPQLQLPHFDESHQRDVFQNYVIRAEHRDALKQHLSTDGVETLVHWAKPVWRHSALGLPDPGLRHTEALCREVLSLPMSGETTEQHVEIVVSSIRSFYAKVRARAAVAC